MPKIEPFIEARQRVDTLTRLATKTPTPVEATQSHHAGDLADLYVRAFITGCKEKESEKDADRGRALEVETSNGPLRCNAFRSESIRPGPVSSDVTLIF